MTDLLEERGVGASRLLEETAEEALAGDGVEHLVCCRDEVALCGKRLAQSRGYTELVYVSIHAVVPGPPDERDAELDRPRAENERLRAAQPADEGPAEDMTLTQPGREPDES